MRKRTFIFRHSFPSIILWAVVAQFAAGAPVIQHSSPEEEIYLITVSDVLDKTWQNNPRLKAAAWNLDISQAKLDQAGRLANPELGLSAATDHAFSNEGEYRWSVSLSQEFPLTHRLRHERKISHHQLEQARAEWNRARQVIGLKAATYWHDAIALKGRKALIERHIEQMGGWIERTRNATDQGEWSAIQATQLRLEYQSMAIYQRRHEAALMETLAKLREILDLPPYQELILPDFKSPTEGPAEYESFADLINLDKLPNIRHSMAAYQEAETAISIARNQRWQDIRLTVELEEERANDAPLGLQSSRFLGISVSIPLPLPNRYDASLRERMAVRHKAQSQITAERHQAMHQTSQLLLQANQKWETAQEWKELLESAQKHSQQIFLAWESGEATMMDIIQAQQKLIEFENAQLEAFIAFQYYQLLLQANLLQGPFEVLAE